jgi:hypothetical protein
MATVTFHHSHRYVVEATFANALAPGEADAAVYCATPGAAILVYNVWRESGRCLWARWYEVGVPGDRAEYYADRESELRAKRQAVRS